MNSNISSQIGRINRVMNSYPVDSGNRYAFALPVACMPMSLAERLILTTYHTASVLPGDTRWEDPTVITGPCDPSVAFAVAVGLEES